MIKNEKILITGVTGAIALPVARFLAKDNEVWGTARFTNEAARRELEEAGVRTVPLDLASGDLGALPDDVSLVLHYAYTRKGSGEFHEAIELNAIAAGRVLQHCQNARAALVLSAATLYSRNEDPHHRYVETDDIGLVAAPWAASSPASKVTLEAVVRFSAEAFDFPVTIARPACPYGTSLDVVTTVVDSVAAGQPVYVTSDPQPYSVIHIDDMCRQVGDLLFAAAVPATIVNWGSDEVVTVQEMAKRAGEIFGVEPKFAAIPTPNVALGGVLDTTLLNSIAAPCKISFRDAFEKICLDRVSALLARN
ncbi:MAG: NAD(P)-dependent oxidoreductase [bacterium]|nr:NAD(P)-dependent oxidoreductase [bacterium]